MFVFIHGAYHGGWCWQRLIDCLGPDGVGAQAPDLPGHGRDPGWLGDQTLPNYTARMIDILEPLPAPANIVAHSMAGAVAVAVAEARPDLIARLVFLCAYIPTDGESTGKVVKQDPASQVRAQVLDVEGRGAISLKAGNLAEAFYQDADPRALGWVEDQVQLQSTEPFRHILSTTASGFGRVPKAAILCEQDRAISYPHQRWMAERAGCDPILTMDSGHSPFVTQPETLADLLRRLTA